MGRDGTMRWGHRALRRAGLGALAACQLTAPLALTGCGGGTDEISGERTPREGYPTGPFGVDRNQVMADHDFLTAEGAPFSLAADVYQAGAQVMVLATAAEWCAACREEAPKLQALKNEFGARGLDVLVTLFEDGDFNPVDPQNAARWITQYKVDYPVVADPDFQLESY